MRYTPNETNVLIKDGVTGQFLNAEGIAKKLNDLEKEFYVARQREARIEDIKHQLKKKKKKVKSLERRIFILEKMVIQQDNEGVKNDN